MFPEPFLESTLNSTWLVVAEGKAYPFLRNVVVPTYGL